MNQNLSPIETLYQLGFEAGWKAKCEDILRGVPVTEGPENRTEEIIQIGCDYFGVKYEQITLKKRKRVLVVPRQICMYFLSKYTGLTLRDIGELFGGRDHTTVIHAKATIRDLMDCGDDQVTKAVATIDKEIIQRGIEIHLKKPIKIKATAIKQPVPEVKVKPRPVAEYSNTSPFRIAKS